MSAWHHVIIRYAGTGTGTGQGAGVDVYYDDVLAGYYELRCESEPDRQ